MNHETLHQRSPEQAKSTKAEASSFEKAQEHVEFGPEKEHQAKAERQTKLERAREQIEELAIEPKLDFSKEAAPPQPPTRREKLQLYQQTLRQIQRQMPKHSSRLFSQFIHQKNIEKLSEAAAKTVFRPSLMLGASLGALLGGTLVYVAAKHYGFALSGSEFLVFGVAGGLIGLASEPLKGLWRKAH